MIFHGNSFKYLKSYGLRLKCLFKLCALLYEKMRSQININIRQVLIKDYVVHLLFSFFAYHFLFENQQDIN